MPIVLHHSHCWDVPQEEAKRLQDTLRGFVRIEPLLDAAVSTVCGVDVSYTGDRVYAAVVVLEYHSLAVIDQALCEQPLTFPYIPGLLSFREAPAILAALEQLSRLPDLLLVDGHGIAHPRRFGIASHLGVLLDKPTIGVAKSVLVGRAGKLGDEAGSVAELVERNEIIGAVLRTRPNVRPVYVSVGHRVDLSSAIRMVLNCTTSYRLPEPCRLAHRLASSSFKVNG